MPLSTSVAVRGYSVHPQCSAPGADVAFGGRASEVRPDPGQRINNSVTLPRPLPLALIDRPACTSEISNSSLYRS